MAVKLHRCPVPVKGRHPCWQVQKALDDAGVEYEVVKHSPLRPLRKELQAKTGQRLLPVIELEDGTFVREQSRELVERVRRGELA